MGTNLFVIRYSEIATKGGNRNWFEDMLLRNIHQHLSRIGKHKITKVYGRIIIESSSDTESIKNTLLYIPGVANFSIAQAADHTIEKISKKAAELMGSYLKNTLRNKFRFKVESQRSDKQFPMNSIEISRQIGRDMLQLFSQLKVDLHTPQIELGIEIWQKNRSIIYLEKIQGQGGLPTGTAGTAISFLSGGIDSPVSSWFMMKRGCKIVYLHFHSYPFTGEQSRQKVIDLVNHLSRFQAQSTLLIVPFTDVQKAIRENCKESFRTILYRRFMYHVANAIRRKHKALAYVTGEALGQVASQTMENIECTENAATLPVLRPLIGMDKAEIVGWSKKIGTFPISIRPFPDCCTVFQSKKPEIHGNVELIKEEELKVNKGDLIDSCVSNIEAVHFETQVQESFWEE